MYTLRFQNSFKLTYKIVIKGNPEKEKRTKKALNLLRKEPFYPSLKSHKVNTRSFGKKWSSWISPDLRLIWDFDQKEKVIIIIFAIASHSGVHKEYR